MISTSTLEEAKESRKTGLSRLLAFLSLSVLIAASLTTFRFSPLRGHSFMGDDLLIITRAQNGLFARSIPSDILDQFDKKIRPVSSPLIGAVVRSCGTDFDCYETTNMVLFSLNGVLFAWLAYRLTRKWALAALLSLVVYVLSRFTFYYILQIYGLMENIGVTFVLLFVISAIEYIRSQGVRWYWSAALCAILAIFSHERYIVLMGPLIVLPFLGGTGGRNRVKSLLSLGALLIPILYFSARWIFFRIPVFIGTGGTRLDRTFNLGSVIDFSFKGIANLIGLNATVDYLGGANYRDAGRSGVLLPLAIGGLLILVVGLALRNARWKIAIREPGPRMAAALIITGLCLILSASITFRQEFRWLFAPFLLFILLVVWMISTLGNRWVKLAAVTLFIALVAANNLYYDRYLKNVYFIIGMRASDSVRENVFGRYRMDDFGKRGFVVVTHGNPDFENWIFEKNLFFSFYSGTKGAAVTYVDEVPQVRQAILPGTNPIVVEIRGTHAEDISGQIYP